MHEHVFVCPHCWQQISMLLDLSVREQAYIEDCEVCCRPIQVYYRAEGGAVVAFRAERIEQ